MTIGKLTVRSIAAGSRPTVAQCSRRIASRGRHLLEVPDVFQASPERATVRSVFFGPEPPMRIGRWAWIGRGQEHRVVKVVEAGPSWSTRLAVEQPSDDPDRLVEPVEALAEARPEVDPEGLVLALEPARRRCRGPPGRR